MQQQPYRPLIAAPPRAPGPVLAISWLFGLAIGFYWQPYWLAMAIITIGAVVAGSLSVKNRYWLILMAVVATAALRVNLPDNEQKITFPQSTPFSFKAKLLSQSPTVNGKTRWQARLLMADTLTLNAKVQLYTNKTTLISGNTVNGYAYWMAFTGPRNPGAFNGQRWARLHGFAGSLLALDSLTITNHQWVWQAPVNQVKNWLSKQATKRLGTHAGLAMALLTGQRAQLNNTQSFYNAGLGHVLAVSGLHTGVVALILALLLKPFGLKTRYYWGVLGLLLPVYAALCGFRPSVVRAVIMFDLYVLARLLQRPIRPSQVVAIAFILLSAYNPLYLTDLGFEMSFTAVIGILAGAKFCQQVPVRRNHFFAWVLKLVVMSLFINIALIPLSLYHFNQLNLNGVIANLWGLPLASALIPLAILALVLPAGAGLVFAAAFKLLAAWLAIGANWCADLPLLWGSLPFNGVQALLLALAIASLGAWLTRKLKPRAAIAFILACTVVIFVIPLIGSSNLQVAFFDCGQGDMAAFVTPTKHVMFIDTGPKPNPGQQLACQRWLSKQGITTIDAVLLSHAHDDHSGGLPMLAQLVKIKQVWIEKSITTLPYYSKLQQLCQQQQIEQVVIDDTLATNWHGVNLKVLHPKVNFENPDENARSLVVKLSYKRADVLFTGDATLSSEQALIAGNHNINCELLKVPHHGSNTSSGPSFVNAVKPMVSFFSAGLYNKYKAPNPQVVARYKNIGTDCVVSATQGWLGATTNGYTINFSGARQYTLSAQ